MSPARATLVHRTLLGVAAVTLMGLLVVGGRDADADTPLLVDVSMEPGRLAELLVADEVAGRTRPVLLAGDAPGARSRGAEEAPAATAPPPPPAELVALLAGAGRRARLVVPDAAPPMTLTAPRTVMAGRRAALSLTVRGPPGEEVDVTLTSVSGVVDTLVVRVPESGVAHASVGVDVERSGGARWVARRLGAGGAVADSAIGRAWARPAEPPSVLVLTGPPTWESRQLVRALENGGMDVALVQELGRDQRVRSRATTVPTTLEELEALDVVVVVEPAPGAPRPLIDRWVSQRGGGLLHVDTRGAGPARADSLTWRGPAELRPLPTLPLDASAAPVAVPPEADALPIVTDAAGRLLQVASWAGRGRIVRSGLETWVWPMEGGASEAHDRFWSSVVGWLADGLVSEPVLSGPPAAEGIAWTGVVRRDGVVERTVRRLPGAEAGRAGSVYGDTLGFVPVAAHEPVGWAESARMVGAAGGRVVVGTAGVELTALAAAPPGPGRAWIGFAVLALLVAAAWAIRRTAGLT